MKTRSELRLIAVQILYQTYVLDSIKTKYLIEDILKDFDEEKDSFAAELISGVLKNEKDITKLANKHLENWTLDRLSLVDKAILSVAIYELLYTEVPHIVAINEAVELAKQFSDEKVIAMINASLDSILHKEIENE